MIRQICKWLAETIAPAFPSSAFPRGLLAHHVPAISLDLERSAFLWADLNAQTRRLLINKVPRITWGVDTTGTEVPLEACYLYVIHPNDEGPVRHFRAFVPSGAYAGRTRFHRDEIGTVWGAKVIVDRAHFDAPKLFGAGQRVAVML